MQWLFRPDYPFTAAAPPRILTGFPWICSRVMSYYQIVRVNSRTWIDREQAASVKNPLALKRKVWHKRAMRTASASAYFGYYFWFREWPPVG